MMILKAPHAYRKIMYFILLVLSDMTRRLLIIMADYNELKGKRKISNERKN